MGYSCANCKYSAFYPTVGEYKCIKHDIWAEDVCTDFTIGSHVPDYTANLGIFDDGKEEGEDD